MSQIREGRVDIERFRLQQFQTVFNLCHSNRRFLVEFGKVFPRYMTVSQLLQHPFLSGL